MDERHTRVNTPLVFNHNLMLKEIRDNLKHLRREPENGSEVNTASVVTPMPYDHISQSTSQNQRISNNQARFFTPRNNFPEPNRGYPERNGQASRNYDESGYSSSSSECSSQSANDFNGQPFVGAMPSYEVSTNFSCLYSVLSTCLWAGQKTDLNTTVMQKFTHLDVTRDRKRMHIFLVYRSYCIFNTALNFPTCPMTLRF